MNGYFQPYIAPFQAILSPDLLTVTIFDGILSQEIVTIVSNCELLKSAYQLEEVPDWIIVSR